MAYHKYRLNVEESVVCCEKIDPLARISPLRLACTTFFTQPSLYHSARYGTSQLGQIWIIQLVLKSVRSVMVHKRHISIINNISKRSVENWRDWATKHLDKKGTYVLRSNATKMGCKVSPSITLTLQEVWERGLCLALSSVLLSQRHSDKQRHRQWSFIMNLNFLSFP